MDFSGSLEGRDLQVMVRVNDGVPELSIKKGGVGDTERQESSVFSRGNLADMLEAVALLGYTEANYGLRRMQECQADGVEVSLRYILDIEDPETVIGVNLEIEALPGSIEQHVDDMLELLGLEPLTKQESKDLFKRLHKEANTDYIHSEKAALEISELAAIYAT